MRNQRFQKPARAAFKDEDWIILMADPSVSTRFADLGSIEETEEFVFFAYERLRSLPGTSQEVVGKGG